MSAGPELVDFRDNLSGALSDLRALRRDAQEFGDSLDAAADASSQYTTFRKIIKNADGVVSATVTTLKLSENVAPLSTPSKALKEVLETIQPLIVRVRDATDKAKKIEPLLDKIEKADKLYKATVLPELETAEKTLATVFAGTQEFVDAFDRVSTADNNPLNDGGGASRPGKASFTGPDQLFGEADAFVRPVNRAVDDAEALAATAEAFARDAAALFEEIGVDFDIASFEELNAIFADVVEFDGIFDVLGPITDIVENTLRPIQPLLDAVGLVTETVVDPAVEYLTSELGVDELFDELARQIEPLFPGSDLFDGFLETVADLERLLDEFDLDAFEVPDFVDAALEAFDRFEQTFEDTRENILAGLDGIPLRIGEEAPQDGGSGGSDTMYGTGGHEAFDPRSGNDTVLANAGNDIIVASAGDDRIDGGAGIDRIVFASEIAAYEFSRREIAPDEFELIFTHTDVGPGLQDEGTEVVTDVEFFDFGTETFTKQQLEEAVVGRSVIDAAGSGPDGARSTDEAELIFLNPGGTLVDGLVLNGQTFDDMNVVYGLGGSDRIQTTQGRDFIFAGPGDDLIVPLRGVDAIQGDAGSDTVQVYDLGRNPPVRVDLADGAFFSGEGNKTLSGVENVIVQHGGGIELFGDGEANTLMSGRGRDFLIGRDGNDALFGAAGRDILSGGDGIDTLRGGEGNDLLIAQQYADDRGGEEYHGDEGFDTLSYAARLNEFDSFFDSRDYTSGPTEFRDYADAASRASGGTTGPVVVRAGAGEIDRLDGNGGVLGTDRAYGVETFVGSSSNDTLFGGGDALERIEIDGANGDDVLHSWGAQEVRGGGGDDLMIAERAPEGGRITLFGFDGGMGVDTLDLRPVGDARFILKTDVSGRINFTAAAKDFAGNPLNARGEGFNVEGTERFILGVNDDWVQWGTGTDGEILGGAGDDYLSSASGVGTQAPTFRGQEGDDTIALNDGGRGFGGAGDDRIEVNSSGDLVAEGGEGNDTFVVRRMDNRLDGGAGYDRLILRPNDGGGVTVNLAAGTALSASSIDLTEVTGIEEVVGSDAADTVTGTDRGERMVLSGGNDRGEGRGGDDQLYGGDGADSLFGGAGNDTLSGGSGDDRLDGGADRDSVDYAFAAPGGEEGELVARIFQAAVVDLGAGTGGRGGERDTLVSVENAFGTLLGDELTGDGGDNVLLGRAGADVLRGQGGDDVLVAGEAGPTGTPDQMFGGDGDDRFVVGSGAFFAEGGAGSDLLDFSGGSDPAEAGGRTLSVAIDLAARALTRDVEVGRVVWAEGGGIAPRSFDGQSISPGDVLRADPLYARDAADLALRLPTGEEASDDVPSFAIEVETNPQTLPQEREAFAGIEDVLGSAGDDAIRGSGAANRLEGGAGDDELEGRGGDDLLIGGEGAADIARFSGNFSDYLVEIRGGEIIVADKRGTDGTDTLRGVELMAFADGARFSDDPAVGDFVSLDNLAGVATLTEAELSFFVEMYIAYFDRAPDSLGLFYWGDRLSEGMTMPEIARSFFVQPESQAAYPDPNDNAQLVDDAYANLLERAPDAEGRAYWIDALTNGDVSRAEFMLAIINGAKAETGDPADARVIAEKADIGLDYAVLAGLNDVERARDVMEAYDRADAGASLARAEALIDGYALAAAEPESGETVVALAGVAADPFA